MEKERLESLLRRDPKIRAVFRGVCGIEELRGLRPAESPSIYVLLYREHYTVFYFGLDNWFLDSLALPLDYYPFGDFLSDYCVRHVFDSPIQSDESDACALFCLKLCFLLARKFPVSYIGSSAFKRNPAENEYIVRGFLENFIDRFS
jgi:hypothetical protein